MGMDFAVPMCDAVLTRLVQGLLEADSAFQAGFPGGKAPEGSLVDEGDVSGEGLEYWIRVPLVEEGQFCVGRSLRAFWILVAVMPAMVSRMSWSSI